MKRFVALLATTLVMALSATTVLAAGSPSEKVPVGVDQTVDFEEGSGLTSTPVSDAEAVAAVNLANAVEEELTKDGDVKNVKVELITNITANRDVTPEDPLTIVFEGFDLSAPEGFFKGVRVLNLHDGTWREVDHKIVNGTIEATFTGLSPVMIITFDVADTASGSGSGSGAGAASDAGVATSPKTGVLPVAAITATICLAGAAVCGKKVKFD